jgi:hypothetical protein
MPGRWRRGDGLVDGGAATLSDTSVMLVQRTRGDGPG